MQPIQINVHVKVGLDSALSALITPLISNLQVGQPAGQKKAAAKTADEVKQSISEDPEPTDAELPAEDPTPARQETVKEYTEVDVREAMDRTRKRIEGKNYKEKTDSEGYKKWHRVLTAWFKNTAAVFGAEKPSALPDSESRRKFIEACDAVYVKDGELTENCPF